MTQTVTPFISAFYTLLGFTYTAAAKPADVTCLFITKAGFT